MEKLIRLYKTSRKKKMTGVLKTLLLVMGLTIVLIWSLLPILWTLRISLMSKVDAFSMPPKLFFYPTFENYIKLFSKAYFGGRFIHYFINSLIVSIGSMSICALLGAIGGYTFSRYKFKGDKFLSFSIIASRMMPPVVLVIPLFLLIKNWGLYDNLIALIFQYTAFNLPFSTWMMKGFVDEIPVDLEESAMVDGCSKLGAFFRITSYLIAPGFIATSIYTFILSWNEFLFAFIMTSTKAKTLAAAAPELIGEVGVEWGAIASMGICALLPAVILTLFASRYLIKGMLLGAVKR
jgi:multiple sugar transport system permease protein